MPRAEVVVAAADGNSENGASLERLQQWAEQAVNAKKRSWARGRIDQSLRRQRKKQGHERVWSEFRGAVLHARRNAVSAKIAVTDEQIRYRIELCSGGHTSE